jgi:hypothetical protein
MNTDKKVFNKLFSAKKVELESQKYEFALKKAPQILADMKKIDDLLLKSEAKIDSSYLAYKKAYSDFQTSINTIEGSANNAEIELVAIMGTLQSLGMNPNEAQKIDGFKAAADLVTKIQQLAPKLRTLYIKPQ